MKHVGGPLNDADVLWGHLIQDVSPALTSKGRSNSLRASFLSGRFSSSTAPMEQQPETLLSLSVLG